MRSAFGVDHGWSPVRKDAKVTHIAEHRAKKAAAAGVHNDAAEKMARFQAQVQERSEKYKARRMVTPHVAEAPKTRGRLLLPVLAGAGAVTVGGLYARRKISKARRHAGITSAFRGQNSMEHRGGEGYFHPTPEQVAASKARRAAQQGKKAEHKINLRDPHFRANAGRKLGLAHHWRKAGALPGTTAVAGLSAAGTAYALHEMSKPKKEALAKALSAERKREIAGVGLGASTGAASTYVAQNVGGQTAKAILSSRRAKRGTSRHEQKIWSEHKAVARKAHRAPHLDYPKSLPDWRGQRALAFKNRPSVVAGTLAAGTAAGAGYGLHRMRRKHA